MRLLTELKPHQIPAVEVGLHCLQKYGGFGELLAMGLGKTRIALELLHKLYSTGQCNGLVIIAPKQACDTWATEELPKHTDLGPTFFWDSAKAGSKTAGPKYKDRYKQYLEYSEIPIFIINIEAFSYGNEELPRYLKHFYSHRKTLSVLDESSAIKSMSSERTKEVLRVVRPSAYRIILTGTARSKSNTDLFPQIELLAPGYWASVLKVPPSMPLNQQARLFKLRFCVVGEKHVGERKIKEYEYTHQDIKDELSMIAAKAAKAAASGRHADAQMWLFKARWFEDSLIQYDRQLVQMNELIAPFVYRLDKKDSGLNLPEKIFTSLKVRLGKEEARVYEELDEELMTRLEGGEVFTYQSRLVLFTKFRQVAGGFLEGRQLEKTPAKISALLADLADTDQQAIIWCNYTAELIAVADALDKIGSTGRYYGGIDQAKRDEEKEKFRSGAHRFLVLNPLAGAYSLNLQNCTLQYWYDRPTQLQRYQQGQDRSHRIGVKDACVYKDLVGIGTVDERINRLLDDGIDVFARFQAFDTNGFAAMLRKKDLTK